jgi:type I restriction-modification system DNA methylase subunit
MDNTYDNLMRIVGATTPREQRLLAIRDFALALNWTPSYEFHGSYGAPVAEDHLVVEHGLENSAIISFLKSPTRAMDLDINQIRSLLTISFNNLIDWHIFVSDSQVRYINNRSSSYDDNIQSLTRTNYAEFLSATYFERMAAAQDVKRSYQSCDDAFIQVLSRWKRLLKADYRGVVENKHISALFNALILVRGCEDQKNANTQNATRMLIDALQANPNREVDLIELASDTLKRCGINEELDAYIRSDRLKPFRKFDRSTAIDFLRDFYRPSSSAYEFNFALMSKHALSRIYERYVALLEFDDENESQLSFIPPTPTERSTAKTGSVYTPQYVAGFFARYLRDNLTPRTFRALRTLDPACGSGIFLRTILELQCNPLFPETTLQTIKEAFASVTGIDRDPNACEATFLSLALLYLVATGSLPRRLDIRNADAIRLVQERKLSQESFGALVANPPYIKRDNLTAEDVRVISRFLGAQELGRIDSYLAFVKLCLDCVQDGGFVCLVLPQAFLFAKNAKFLRKLISSKFYIRCVVDLSSIEVFEGVGTYNVLLITQKRTNHSTERPAAQIAKINEFVGPALQACLERKQLETPYYAVFEVPQSYFETDEWVLLSPSDIVLQQRVSQFKPISHYLNVKQGFVSGADDIFIIAKKNVPASEKAIYLDYLPDRQIFKYAVPSRAERVVFYPYSNGEPLSESKLKKDYPQTWKYLTRHKDKLQKRQAVTSGDTPWWRPVRPRDPANLLRPKIVCPHLMLTPRFALDLRGRYAVSHAPFLVAKKEAEEATFLKFFCAVLNSSVSQWYLSTYLPKYGRDYKRVEVSSLRSVPVPDPAKVSSVALTELLGLVDTAVKNGATAELDVRLNQLVGGFYGLTSAETRLLVDSA